MYPVIATLRMAVILLSLLDNLENGYYFSLILEKVWDFSKSLIFQIINWWIWLIHSSVRFWFECFWGLIASTLLPFIWPVFLVIQLGFGMDFSSSVHSKNRNSIQRSSSRRKRKLDNYNFSRYWYLSNMECTVIDQKYGVFNSNYAIYSWWSSFLLRQHIMKGDLDISVLISTSIWAASVFLSFPYKVFQAPPKKPPDGCILRTLVLIYVAIVGILAIVYSVTAIIGVKIGIIWIQTKLQITTKTMIQQISASFLPQFMPLNQ